MCHIFLLLLSYNHVSKGHTHTHTQQNKGKRKLYITYD